MNPNSIAPLFYSLVFSSCRIWSHDTQRAKSRNVISVASADVVACLHAGRRLAEREAGYSPGGLHGYLLSCSHPNTGGDELRITA